MGCLPSLGFCFTGSVPFPRIWPDRADPRKGPHISFWLLHQRLGPGILGISSKDWYRLRTGREFLLTIKLKSMQLMLWLIIITVAVIIVLMVLYYKITLKVNESTTIHQEVTTALHQETNSLLEELIKKLGTRFSRKEAAVSSLLKMEIWNTLIISNARNVPLELFLLEFLKTTNGQITEEILHESPEDPFADNSGRSQLFKIETASGEENLSDTVILEFTTDWAPLSAIEDSEKFVPYARDKDFVSVIKGLRIYTPKDCQGDCPLDTMALCQRVANSAELRVKYLPKVFDKSIMAVWSYNDKTKTWTYGTMPVVPVEAPILDLCYPVLQTKETTPKLVPVRRLLETIGQQWKENIPVRIAFLGKAGTGKSRLLRLLAHKANECGQKVATVTVGALEKLLETSSAPFADLVRNSDKGGVVVFIDEVSGIPAKLIADLNTAIEGMVATDLSFVLAGTIDSGHVVDETLVRQGRMDLTVEIGLLSVEQTAKLYNALVAKYSDLKWDPLKEGEPMTLGGVFGLGKKLQFAEKLDKALAL